MLVLGLKNVQFKKKTDDLSARELSRGQSPNHKFCNWKFSAKNIIGFQLFHVLFDLKKMGKTIIRCFYKNSCNMKPILRT